MKKTLKKLTLNRETLNALDSDRLARIDGGIQTTGACTFTCPFTQPRTHCC